MLDALLEPFSQAFLVRAMITGVLASGLSALLGVFIVQRGLAFIGDGLAHAAFGGIALGLLWGLGLDRMDWVAIPFTALVAYGIAYVLRRNLRGDVATSVFSSASFALGVLLLGLRKSSSPAINVETVLFGSILAISEKDVYVMAAVAVLTVGILLATFPKLAYATFDPELAKLSGVNVRVLDYLLLVLTAIVVVVAVKTVGVALVSSFVVIPAATARMLGRTIGRVTVLAVVLGVVCTVVGLIASYHLNVASGATIILTLGIVFAIALALRVRQRAS